ncbi:MAG: STAS domain-containing protein [Gammaproteobacteria bacterium]|nr:STAS domain-containing protein [Gammaproteobacteria bacterium]MCB1851011.1 STAS domain-containing protein [Gammaproteobacteria bacterium]
MSVQTVESSENNQVVIKVSGRFDFTCHQEFVSGYRAYPPGLKSYVVDLSQTEFMDSSAMGMLLQLREYGDKKSGVSLVKGRDSVKDILRIANFDKLFTIV